jgi:hypothetical protein
MRNPRVACIIGCVKHLTSEERRKRIVRGAMEAFSKSGFKGTRSRDLAAVGGGQRGADLQALPQQARIQKAIIEERIRQTGNSSRPR